VSTLTVAAPSCGVVTPRKPVGYAYCITNLKNGKRYIGIGIKPHARWAEHKRLARLPIPKYALHKAIAKHGVENFTFDIIASASTSNAILDLERILIAQYGTRMSVGGCGYNMTAGGEGMWGFKFSLESRILMSTAKKGKPGTPHTEQIRASMIAFHTGRIRSDATRQKQRAAKIGTRQTAEHRASISAALKGKPKSEAHKAAAAAGFRKAIATTPLPNRGPCSEETRAKISEANKGHKPSKAAIAASIAAWMGSKQTVEAKEKIAAASRAMHARRRELREGRAA
jgi:group I intron endonuclease